MTLQTLTTKLRSLLQGEPLRAIVYGAAVVVWLVTHIAVALGFATFGPAVDLDTALLSATAAAALLTELARRWVFSPKTVDGIIDELNQ